MPTESRLTCICIKWGTLYPTEHVNRLYRAVLRNTKRDVDFYCMTENADGLDSGINVLPLAEQPYDARMVTAQKTVKKQGALKKIAMFNPALYSENVGPVLALDLDILITGDLDELADFAPGHVVMRGPFAPDAEPRTYGEGSFIKFEPKHHSFLYTSMAENPEGAVEMCKGSEQTYTSATAHQNEMFTPYPSDWIVSFKYHCRPKRPLNLLVAPKLPEQARIVCFHGRPNVDEAMNGFKSDPLHSTKPAKWISDNWV